MDTLIERANDVRLVVLDVDGVLTDGRLYFTARGEEMKCFHVRDGAGIVQLLRADIVREYLDADQIARHWSDVRAGAFEGAAELTRALMVGRFLLRFA